LEDIGPDEITQLLLSQTVLDQKQILSGWAKASINNTPTLQSHANSVIKPPGRVRKPKVDLKAIAKKVEKHLKDYGSITYRQAKEAYSLRDATQFKNMMDHVKNKIRSTARHVDGKTNWYYHEDFDPAIWISPHDKGRIDIMLYPEEAAKALLDMALNSATRSIRPHHVMAVKEKSKFKLPDKFTLVRCKEWCDSHFTGMAGDHGFNPNSNRTLYKKQ
jgi:hypothetical protein